MSKFNLIEKDWVVFPTKDKIASCSWNKLTNSLPIDNTKAYGVRCGETSGVCVVDVDTKWGSLLFEKALIENNIAYNSVSTPKGYHYYFDCDKFEKDLPNGPYDHKIFGNLDIRNNEKGYVIGPGSVTQFGKYEPDVWGPRDHFDKVKFVLSDLIKAKKAKKALVANKKKEIEYHIPAKQMHEAKVYDLKNLLYFLQVKDREIPNSYISGFYYYIRSKTSFNIKCGQRNNTLYTIATCIIYQYPRFVEYLDCIMNFLNRTICEAPLFTNEILNIVKNVWKLSIKTKQKSKRSIINKIRDHLIELYNEGFKKGFELLKTFLRKSAEPFPVILIEDYFPEESYGFT